MVEVRAETRLGAGQSFRQFVNRPQAGEVLDPRSMWLLSGGCWRGGALLGAWIFGFIAGRILKERSALVS